MPVVSLSCWCLFKARITTLLLPFAASPDAEPDAASAPEDMPPLPDDPGPSPAESLADPAPTSPTVEAGTKAPSRALSRSPEPQGLGRMEYRAEPVRAATPPDPPLPPEPSIDALAAALLVSSTIDGLRLAGPDIVTCVGEQQPAR